MGEPTPSLPGKKKGKGEKSGKKRNSRQVRKIGLKL
jgi:hypothetical protein